MSDQSQRPRPRCYLAIPQGRQSILVRDAAEYAMRRAGYETITSSVDLLSPTLSPIEGAINTIAQSDLVVADISEENPSVFYELGQAQSMGKGIIGILDVRSPDILSIAFPKIHLIRYDRENLDSFVKALQRAAANFKRFPGRFVRTASSPLPIPFYIDWDKLSDRDTENLCQELLSQMGYRRIRWGELPLDVDIVAELPRKDPDGFDYSDLWLVSLGRKQPAENMIDMALSDPEYFLHQVFRYSESPNRLSDTFQSNVVTLLVINTDRSRDESESLRLQERLEVKSARRREGRTGVRVRLWDRSHLTSIVQRFPQIAYKYFSDESRLRSETRKTFEDLYYENTELIAVQQKLISDLNSEKDKRVRAERDSVWKEISFSAAHKIGNPIFAIETGLDPLRKRIMSKDTEEAIEVVEKISRSVEKAKSFIDQFKSLARAQKIDVTRCLLKPILLDSSKMLLDKGISCEISCEEHLEVMADPDRLAECFDELATNALHWMDKKDKKVEVIAKVLSAKGQPPFLDTKVRFVQINFRDNGQGVPVADKSRIFEAFVTDYEHGTGLGLALVRRIVEGHGGSIIETGKPGTGADFELYIPVAPDRAVILGI